MNVEIFTVCKDIKTDIGLLTVIESTDTIMPMQLPAKLSKGFIVAKVRFHSKEKPKIFKVTIMNPIGKLSSEFSGHFENPVISQINTKIFYICIAFKDTPFEQLGKYDITLWINSIQIHTIPLYCIPVPAAN